MSPQQEVHLVGGTGRTSRRVMEQFIGRGVGVRGVLGPPHDLVPRATTRLCRAIEALRPARPTRFVVMSSVSVRRAGGLDARRMALEKAFLWMRRGLLPPARDDQEAADLLQERIEPANPLVPWAVVRPVSMMSRERTRGPAIVVAAGPPC